MQESLYNRYSTLEMLEQLFKDRAESDGKSEIDG
jgi:hypothetical protein